MNRKIDEPRQPFMRTIFRALICVSLIVSRKSVNAFPTTITSMGRISMTKMQAVREDNNHEYAPKSLGTNRRTHMVQTIKSIFAYTTMASIYSSSPQANPPSANAMVYFDPAQYGDKETKSATASRLRQNLRDIIAKDPSLAPLFLELVLHDALSYNAATKQGGPDGSILSIALRADCPGTLKRLKPAAEALRGIVDKMKRSNGVTCADALSFAGAEAVECMNGPKVPVQLGKLDAPASAAGNEAASYAYIDFISCGPGEILSAFRKSGLTERDAALLFGGLVALDRATAKPVNGDSELSKKEVDDDDESFLDDEEIAIDNTFSAAKFSNSLGQIDENIFVSISKEMKGGKSGLPSAFRDEQVVGWVEKYSMTKYNFSKDFTLAYGKLISLGAQNTGSGTDDF